MGVPLKEVPSAFRAQFMYREDPLAPEQTLLGGRNAFVDQSGEMPPAHYQPREIQLYSIIAKAPTALSTQEILDGFRQLGTELKPSTLTGMTADLNGKLSFHNQKIVNTAGRKRRGQYAIKIGTEDTQPCEIKTIQPSATADIDDLSPYDLSGEPVAGMPLGKKVYRVKQKSEPRHILTNRKLDSGVLVGEEMVDKKPYAVVIFPEEVKGYVPIEKFGQRFSTKR